MRRHPGFTSTAVLTLAAGIGATSAIFGVVDTVLLRPLPYREPDRLFVSADTTYRRYEDWKGQGSLALYSGNSGVSRATITGPGEPEDVVAGFVSASLFPLLDVEPLLGRTFSNEEETRRDRVVVVSERMWERRFHRDPEILGQTIQLDTGPAKIIGVMPPAFQFPGRDREFWAPYTINRYLAESIARGLRQWRVIGRIPRDGMVPLGVEIGEVERKALYILLSAVGCMLLMACANVANLLVVRGSARAREMALRTALWAGRPRLLRQLLTESVMLSLAAAALGTGLAWAGIRAIVAFSPVMLPRLEQSRIDSRILLFTIAVSLASALLAGLAPALGASRTNPSEALKSRSRGSKPHDLLVAGEIAAALVLLTGAGLLIRSFLAVQSIDPGFRAENVLVMQMTLPGGTAASGYAPRVLERMRAIPGVAFAGGVSGLFQLGGVQTNNLRVVEGRPPEREEDRHPLTWDTVGGDFFPAIGARLLRGRYPNESDTANSPLVVVIDEKLARLYWPGEDAIGKRFKGHDRRGRNDDWLTVIGVIATLRRNGLEREPAPRVYQWAPQASGGHFSHLIVRTTGDPLALARTMREAVRQIDPRPVLSPVTTLEQQLSRQTAQRRFQTWLLSLFAIAALALAAIGIYGVLEFAVSQRTHELGLRIALGARRYHVVSLVVRQGFRPAIPGLAFGIAASLATGKLLESILFGVASTDPPALAGACVLLLVAALTASFLPSLRAAKVQPIEALRHE